MSPAMQRAILADHKATKRALRVIETLNKIICPICGWTPKPRPGFPLEQQAAIHRGYHALSGEVK